MNSLRLGVLISGGGTTCINLINSIQDGRLPAEIVCVVSSSYKATGNAKVQDHDIPLLVLPKHKSLSDEAYSEQVNLVLTQHQVDLVVLGGFLKRYLPGSAFKDKCVNIHPSLIPAFCGKGFYGMKVHEAVWSRGCRVSGCTVHLVNDEYDAGPIVLQRTVALNDDDLPHDIQKRVFELECDAYPDAIQLFANRQVRVVNGRVVIKRD